MILSAPSPVATRTAAGLLCVVCGSSKDSESSAAANSGLAPAAIALLSPLRLPAAGREALTGS